MISLRAGGGGGKTSLGGVLEGGGRGGEMEVGGGLILFDLLSIVILIY